MEAFSSMQSLPFLYAEGRRIDNRLYRLSQYIFLQHVLTILSTHTSERCAIEIDEKVNFTDNFVHTLSCFIWKMHSNKH